MTSDTLFRFGLARAVMKARQAIGDGGAPALIRSVPRVDHHFVPPLDHEAAALRGPLPPRRAADALRIALLPFENATGDASLGWLALGLMALVVNALGNHPKLAPVSLQSLLMAVDGAAARAAQRDCLAALGTAAHGYLVRLAPRYEGAARRAALPPAPCLPSRP